MLSLKEFHVLFIVLSIGLTIGFGLWALPRTMTLGIGSFVVGAVLAIYLCKVFRRI